jgi:hypothetical protein
MGGRQAPEVNKEAVPRALLGITMLEGLEGEVGCAPGKGSDNVLIFLENIERSALVATVKVCLQDLAGIVVGRLACEDGTSRFQKLSILSV